MSLAPVARGLMIAVTAQFVFTINDTCSKLLAAKYSVFQVLSMQALVGAGIIVAILASTAQLRFSSISSPRRLAMRGLLAAFGALTNIYAFSLLPLADVYAIVFCAPLIVTALSAPLLGEHVGLRRWIAVAIGFSGMFVMVQPGVAPFSIGHAAALLSAFISACVVLLLRSIASSEPRSMMVAVVVAAHFAVGLPIALVTGRLPDLPDIPVVVLAGGCLALGQFLMVESLRLAPAATVAPMQYTKLIWGLLIGYLLFADRPHVHVMTGAFIIMMSVFYIIKYSPKYTR